MRKWHRWLSVFFGVFLLWIAATGVASQFAALIADQQAKPAAAQPVAAQAAPAFVCPENYICRPKPQPGSAKAWESTLHHLHAGETFGPIGVAISILSGLALVFFSLSGVWMYVQMWRNRKSRGLHADIFWK